MFTFTNSVQYMQPNIKSHLLLNAAKRTRIFKVVTQFLYTFLVHDYRASGLIRAVSLMLLYATPVRALMKPDGL